jgi:protein-disulfide isomerase
MIRSSRAAPAGRGDQHRSRGRSVTSRSRAPRSTPLAAALLGFLLGAPAAAQDRNVSPLGYEKGNPGAPITIIEFGDFGCSACGHFVRETFPQFNREFIATGRVRWKFVPFVLGSFPNSGAATRAAECAAEQDAFWSMHDLLYANQKEWTRLTGAYGQLEKYARQLGLNLRRFRSCYDQDRPAARVNENNRVASELLIRATPTFFINGQRAVGALPIEQWRRVIEVVSRRGGGES